MWIRIIFLSFILIYPAAFFGHEIQTSVQKKTPVVIVKSLYANNEPLAYTAVSVFSPENDTNEFQAGFTDIAGNFAFLPDQSGEWKFVIDDELGHRKTLVLQIDEDFFLSEQQSQQDYSMSDKKSISWNDLPVYLKAIFGLIIIFGLTGCFYWIKTARKTMEK